MKMQKKKLFLKYFLNGILAALPYVFPKLWVISYVMLVPFVYMLLSHGTNVTKRCAYLNGLAFGLGYFGVMFHWFTEFYPMDFAGISKGTAALLVVVCWIGLALVQALEFGFVPLLYRLLRAKADNMLYRASVITALWVLFEWQQNFFWRGVPWARLAITQTEALNMLQIASVFGGLFVSGLIVAVNALLAVAVKHAAGLIESTDVKAVLSALKNKRTVLLASVAVGLVLANSVYGSLRLAFYKEETTAKIKVAAVQGNLSSLDKWSSSPARSLKTYVDLTEKCIEETGAKLIVWPETVIPADIGRHGSFSAAISELAAKHNVTILVGAFASNSDMTEEYNAIYVFHPDGKLDPWRYYKRKLVPFGEYVPMEKFIYKVLPVLETFNLFNDPLTPGKYARVIRLQDWRTEHLHIGPLICFDSIYSGAVRDTVKQGATVLTLSTNDSWFSDSPAVRQHASHAQLRAIEYERPIVRSATTGVSMVISPTGHILDSVEPLVEGYVTADVYAQWSTTPYTVIGDAFVYLCIAFLVIALIRSMDEHKGGENVKAVIYGILFAFFGGYLTFNFVFFLFWFPFVFYFSVRKRSDNLLFILSVLVFTPLLLFAALYTPLTDIYSGWEGLGLFLLVFGGYALLELAVLIDLIQGAVTAVCQRRKASKEAPLEEQIPDCGCDET